MLARHLEPRLRDELLGIGHSKQLLSHMVVGAGWEGHCIENLLSCAQMGGVPRVKATRWQPTFRRCRCGACAKFCEPLETAPCEATCEGNVDASSGDALKPPQFPASPAFKKFKARQRRPVYHPCPWTLNATTSSTPFALL